MQEFFMYEHQPFYKTYPIEGWMEREKDIEREYMQMISLFSKEAQLFWESLKIRLNQMEYDGSPMYDAYPDKNWMRRIGSGLANEQKENFLSLTEEDVYMIVVWEVFYRRAKKRRANLLV